MLKAIYQKKKYKYTRTFINSVQTKFDLKELTNSFWMCNNFQSTHNLIQDIIVSSSVQSGGLNGVSYLREHAG